MFLLSFIFSTTMPMSNLWGFLFFFFKFYVEKYNMIFVYIKEFEAKGKFRSSIIPILVVSILLA
jgi:hypothetical protein